MNDTPVTLLEPGGADLAVLRRAVAGNARFGFTGGWRNAVAAGRATVERVVGSGHTVYGINTGFGRLAQASIDAADLERLQTKLLLSHASGVGQRLPDPVVRLVLLLKANSLARGHSGVRIEIVERLLEMLNRDLLPVIPSRGSVGASGDLAPLAHMSLPLVGRGELVTGGQARPAAEVLREHGLEPLDLKAKEGLALLNGTQVSTALALDGALVAQDLLRAAVMIGACAVDAALGSVVPFDPRIHELRGHPGQKAVAGELARLLEGSAINASHADCEKVQDPYCLRCQPQVLGACLDQIVRATGVLVVEANAVSDNPLVFAGEEEILSGGNFHAEPVAFAADNLALAIAEIGALAERRIAMLIDAGISQLPAFLTDDPGLNSGFMIAHVSAAALASENKSLAHPASVDSLPTSANQEDHVSMATFAARRLADMNANVTDILAIEYLAVAQALDFRRPLVSTDAVEGFVAKLRRQVPAYRDDREFAPDIAAAAALIRSGVVSEFLPGLFGR